MAFYANLDGNMLKYSHYVLQIVLYKLSINKNTNCNSEISQATEDLQ